MEAFAQGENGVVSVVVRDEADLVIPGVRILLDGVVNRESVTDKEGRAVIDDLPFGTYQLQAMLPGFLEARVSVSVRHALPTEQLVIMRPGWMKEPGYAKPVRHILNTGCRAGDPPTSIPEFVKRADAVAHIRVRQQRGGERRVPSDAQSHVITRNVVDVLAVFKPHALWPSASYRAEIRQVGGDLDRGDHIEVVRNICLDPLIVGREYVLALERSDWLGGWGVFFGAEGALLINGFELDPLGGGEFARYWRSQPVADLLARLKLARR